jgi:NADH dehydrogenase/NADH:ubiquinone oxidoreductase subunit G
MRRVGLDDGTGGLEEVANHDGVLFVLGDELPDVGEGFGAQASLYVFLGSYPASGPRSADAVLPITTFAEQEGSFTNWEGRVQRFWPALEPPGSARAAWEVLGALSAGLSDEPGPTGADEAFDRFSELAPEFGALTFVSLGTRGVASGDTQAGG